MVEREQTISIRAREGSGGGRSPLPGNVIPALLALTKGPASPAFSSHRSQPCPALEPPPGNALPSHLSTPIQDPQEHCPTPPFHTMQPPPPTQNPKRHSPGKQLPRAAQQKAGGGGAQVAGRQAGRPLRASATRAGAPGAQSSLPRQHPVRGEGLGMSRITESKAARGPGSARQSRSPTHTWQEQRVAREASAFPGRPSISVQSCRVSLG